MPSPQTMRCLGCGYDLRGLPENRCPECGRAFDPDDASTFDDGKCFPIAPLVWALLGVGGVAWGLLGLVVVPIAWSCGYWMAGYSCAISPILGWLFAGYSLSTCIDRLRRRRWARHYRATLTIAIDAAALLPLVLLVVYGALYLLLEDWA